MPLHIEVIGYIAAFLTTLAFVPQALKVWRDDDTRAISLGMYSMFMIGILLWLVYAFEIQSYPMIFANSITFALAGMILVKKVAHLRRGES
jgi:MtN3 and saliva related transmembrane protein